MKTQIAFLAGSISIASFGSIASAAPTWTEVYSQSTGSGVNTTHSLRGLALSQDGTSIYGGFIKGDASSGNRNGAAFAEWTLAGGPPTGILGALHHVNVVDPTTLRQAEAVTTDDRGFVYGASIKDGTSSTPNARVTILNSNFASFQHFSLSDITSPPNNANGETIGGLDLRKSGSSYQLYVTRFLGTSAYVERYAVGGASVGTLTLTPDTTFNSGSSQLNVASLIPGANSLRGIDVAADGTMFIASRENNAVYKIGADLTTVDSETVSGAMDLALYGGKVYVTQYLANTSAIVELNQSDLLSTDTFTATGTFPHPETSSSGYSGIDVDSLGRLYLADQLFVGSGGTRSDRILVSSPVPEPASLALIGLASLGLVRRRWGARKIKFCCE